jgi:DNA-binding NarL/FixJ family response regulator
VSKIRALLAEDHAAMIQKVADLLGGFCEIVGSVSDGRALLDAAEQQHPDVIVLDISMPVMSGIEAAERLIRGGTAAKLVFLTVHDDPDFVQAALATGASGYVLKSRMATDLIPAIKEALAGHRFISRSTSISDSHAV